MDEFNPSTLKPRASFFSATNPGNLAIAPEGNNLYVGDARGTTVTSLNLPGLTLNQQVRVNGSVNLALSGSGAVVVAGASENFTKNSDWLIAVRE